MLKAKRIENLKEIQDYVNKYMSSIDIEYKEGKHVLEFKARKRCLKLQSVEGILDTLIYQTSQYDISKIKCKIKRHEARYFISDFLLKNAVKTFIIDNDNIVFALESTSFLSEWNKEKKKKEWENMTPEELEEYEKIPN